MSARLTVSHINWVLFHNLLFNLFYALMRKIRVLFRFYSFERLQLEPISSAKDFFDYFNVIFEKHSSSCYLLSSYLTAHASRILIVQCKLSFQATCYCRYTDGGLTSYPFRRQSKLSQKEYLLLRDSKAPPGWWRLPFPFSSVLINYRDRILINPVSVSVAGNAKTHFYLFKNTGHICESFS